MAFSTKDSCVKSQWYGPLSLRLSEPRGEDQELFVNFLVNFRLPVRKIFILTCRRNLQGWFYGGVVPFSGFWAKKWRNFLTWWILEKTRKWRPKDGGVVVGRAEFSQVSCVLRVCQLCKCSCPDEIRLVMAEAPSDRVQEYQAS
ncbi:uncharacterized protein LOC144925459 [Branchiostoma floridae x Branchiostoma belcheri]